MKINNFTELREEAANLGTVKLAVVMADDPTMLKAVSYAASKGITEAVLIGDSSNIRQLIDSHEMEELQQSVIIDIIDPEDAVLRAVQLVNDRKADMILKGRIRTDQLLRAILKPDHGLRSGKLLSDIMIYEDTLSGICRFVAITDGGINIAPDLNQKSEILKNALEVMYSLGFECPRIAVMSATEAISQKIPSTLDAAELTKKAAQNAFGNCEVFGPLALDNALLQSAAAAKGIRSNVAGQADILLVPGIEAGNLLGKSVKYFGKSQCAHVVVGARVPILIPSRVESADDKINSIALGAVVHGR